MPGDTWVLPHAALPPIFHELPEADGLVESPLSVSGSFAVEVFAGDCIVTLGLLMAKVPVLKPWDSKFGARFDALKMGTILIQLVLAVYIVCAALAPSCQSL